jgi:hypothetical protein
MAAISAAVNKIIQKNGPPIGGPSLVKIPAFYDQLSI